MGVGYAQEMHAPKIVRAPVTQQSADLRAQFPPMKDPATTEQIREYLRLSGDLDSFRVRWITALDGNRSLGAPYWPESFWTALKAEMQETDLTPMFIVFYQHGISRELMQQVIDAYNRLGAEHFRGSPECFKFGEAELALAPDMDKLKLAKTGEVFNKVYADHKAEIKAARLQYQVEHPGWVGK